MQRRLRLWTVIAFLCVGVILVWLTDLAVRFPAAAIPAILSAVWGYYRAGQLAAKNPSLLPNESARLIQGHTLLWSIPGGALGYAVLAGLAVGVPAPDADLGWRIFGGAVFGAAAGAGAGCFVPLIALIPTAIRLFRPRRAA